MPEFIGRPNTYQGLWDEAIRLAAARNDTAVVGVQQGLNTMNSGISALASKQANAESAATQAKNSEALARNTAYFSELAKYHKTVEKLSGMEMLQGPNAFTPTDTSNVLGPNPVQPTKPQFTSNDLASQYGIKPIGPNVALERNQSAEDAGGRRLKYINELEIKKAEQRELLKQKADARKQESADIANEIKNLLKQHQTTKEAAVKELIPSAKEPLQRKLIEIEVELIKRNVPGFGDVQGFDGKNRTLVIDPASNESMWLSDEKAKIAISRGGKVVGTLKDNKDKEGKSKGFWSFNK